MRDGESFKGLSEFKRMCNRQGDGRWVVVVRRMKMAVTKVLQNNQEEL
jgi:hypothetical protein